MTRRQILIYSVLLLPIGMSPWLAGYAGALYGAIAFVTGALMIALAVRLWRAGDGPAAEPAAKQLFAFSHPPKRENPRRKTEGVVFRAILEQLIDR